MISIYFLIAIHVLNLGSIWFSDSLQAFFDAALVVVSRHSTILVFDYLFAMLHAIKVVFFQ